MKRVYCLLFVHISTSFSLTALTTPPEKSSQELVNQALVYQREQEEGKGISLFLEGLDREEGGGAEFL